MSMGCHHGGERRDLPSSTLLLVIDTIAGLRLRLNAALAAVGSVVIIGSSPVQLAQPDAASRGQVTAGALRSVMAKVTGPTYR